MGSFQYTFLITWYFCCIFFYMKENIVVLHINQRYLELIAFRGICETLKKEIDM